MGTDDPFMKDSGVEIMSMTKAPLAPHRRLTLEDAIAIRTARRAGKTPKELSAEYQVEQSHVYGVLSGRSMRASLHVEVDDESYLRLANSAKFAGMTVAQYAAKILADAAK